MSPPLTLVENNNKENQAPFVKMQKLKVNFNSLNQPTLPPSNHNAERSSSRQRRNSSATLQHSANTDARLGRRDTNNRRIAEAAGAHALEALIARRAAARAARLTVAHRNIAHAQRRRAYKLIYTRVVVVVVVVGATSTAECAGSGSAIDRLVDWLFCDVGAHRLCVAALAFGVECVARWLFISTRTLCWVLFSGTA
jgi:hypothetical protein